VKTGICSADSLINILLCMLGFLPGLLHAWYIIAKYPDPLTYDRIQDAEEGGRPGAPQHRVTYVYVQSPGPSPLGHPHHHGAHGHHGHHQSTAQGYGTLKPMDASTSTPQQRPNGSWGQGSQPDIHEHDHQSGEGSSHPPNPPPTYADAVKGDNKVQHD
jgi:hypothetical protein